MRRPTHIVAYSVFLVGTCVGFAQELPKSQVPPSEVQASKASEVQGWIDGLQSDDFAVREWATEKLTEAGLEIVQPLSLGIKGFDVESTIRGLGILHALALEDDDSSSAAEEAIRQLANERATSGSQRAKDTLTAIVAEKPKRAERLLRRLGAQFDLAAKTYANAYVTVSIGNEWKGKAKDLRYLGWLTNYREIAVKASGDAVNDRWMGALAQIPNLAELSLKDAKVTDVGMAEVQNMRMLRHLRIHYCDVTDRSLENLVSPESNLKSVFLFGTQISDAAVKKVKEERAGLIVRFGLGGFLGIAGQANVDGVAGCKVTDVTANEAASKADIRRNDIILEYNGQKVSKFVPFNQQPAGYVPPIMPQGKSLEDDGPSLSELIGKNRPGERVKVRIQRNGYLITKEVELGRWP